MKILCTILFIIGLQGPFFASAQHHWLQAEPGVADKKQAVRLTLLAGDKLQPQTGSEVPKIENFTLYQAKDSFSLGEGRTGGTLLVDANLVTETFLAAAKLTLPGKNLLLPDSRKQFTKEQKAIVATLDSAVLKNEIAAERAHYVKTLVPVKRHRDKAQLYKRQLNHSLEILLNSDPSEVKPGGYVAIQILLHQRVLPNQTFTVWRQDKNGKIEVSRKSTNKYGVQVVTVPEPGRYVITVSQEGPHKIGLSDTVHWKSLEASFSFVVQ